MWVPLVENNEYLGSGADYFIEKNVKHLLDQALRVITRGGSISLLGIFGEPPRVDLSELVIMKGVRLHGIYGRRIYDTWERTQSLLRAGLDVTPIITHRLSLDDWPQAFDLIASRHAGAAAARFSQG